MRPKLVTPVSVTLWKVTIPTTPSRIGGPRRATPESGPPLLVKPVASNVRGGRGFARGRNALNERAIHLDLIRAPRHYW
jgi:hypothetical protein